MRRLYAFILAPAIAAVAACGREAPRTLAVRDAWTRPADVATVTAVYLVVENHERAAATLTRVTSPDAESVSLHETMQMNGMVHMMPMDSVQTIAAGDSLVLSEGGKHLMVGGLRRTLAGGDSLALTLSFADGRTVLVTAKVRAP